MLSKVKYVFSFLLIFVCLLQTSDVQASENQNTILIISSYNPAAHQTTVTISDFMDEYIKKSGRCNIEIENMNCKSFSEAPRWKGMMTNILSKYQGIKTPELIILLGQEAWAAYVAQGDSIMGSVPVMCSLTSRNSVMLPDDSVSLKEWLPQSVDFFTDDVDPNKKLRSGFVYEYDMSANLRMIKHFYPNAKHIAFLSDNTYGGVSMQALVRKEMLKFPDLDLILLDGRSNTVYTIMDKLRELPEHTILLIGTWRVDMNEGYFMRNATYSMMEANSSPAFAPATVGLGHWTAGGIVPAYRDLGVDMAHEVIRMETHPEDTTQHIEIIGSRAVFDYGKVQALKLDVKSLPYEVQIVNQPPTFYEQYVYQIWGGSLLMIILVGGLCISLYFYFRTHRLTAELLQSDAELRDAKNRAEEANRLKSAFLANMSHEIRTPLNAIVGFSDVLVAGGSTEEERSGYCEIIQSNSDLLLRLINDILDLSRLEADRIVLTFEPCDVASLCRRTLTSVSMARKASNNKLIFASDYEEFELTTDVQRMQQVIINLLTNAAKFTSNGTITLSLKIDSQHNRALFSVTDTGCGIPKEKQNLVFERFEKLNEYAQGTGLGLSICKLTVEKWGGEIWVDPDYTGGARFVFSHPLNM